MMVLAVTRMVRIPDHDTGKVILCLCELEVGVMEDVARMDDYNLRITPNDPEDTISVSLHEQRWVVRGMVHMAKRSLNDISNDYPEHIDQAVIRGGA